MKEKVGGDPLVTWVKHTCNNFLQFWVLEMFLSFHKERNSSQTKWETRVGHGEQKKIPHMKNNPTLMAQEKAVERRKIGNFTGKTLGTEEEAAKKAWLHPLQKRTAVHAFKVERVFMDFF